MKNQIEILANIPSHCKHLLSEKAKNFLFELHKNFSVSIENLLEKRRQKQAYFNSGHLPSFLEETQSIRNSDWKASDIPPDLKDRRVEITGPASRKMIINALNSGAKVFMADFEDSLSPTFSNLIEGQNDLYDAVRKTIEFYDEKMQKLYRLNKKTAVLMVRSRGLHLLEKHVLVGGACLRGSLFDFGLYFFHNAQELLKRQTGPYFYLPKLESHLEARLWNEIFNFAENYLSVPRNSIKATVLIETLPAAFEMDEILYELREHIVGLNCGRWDYIFSYIKTLQQHGNHVLPDRSQVSMEQPMMRAYTQLLIKTCHKRGAFAMGGMAAQIPVKNDSEANSVAFSKVQQDKLREVKEGHDGTWVAHPGLVAVAQAVFDQHMPTPNQLFIQKESLHISQTDLLRTPMGTCTLEGLRHNIRVGIQYLASWLSGQGCVPLYNLMEDAATAEISRTQIWQWIHHHTVLTEGYSVTKELISMLIKEEARLFHGEKTEEASALFLQLSTETILEDFLTTRAYGSITSIQKKGENMESSYQETYLDTMRFKDCTRPYAFKEVKRLRGSVVIEHTLAQLGAQRLWELMHTHDYIHALGAMTGNQAVQQIKAGLKAIYCSGWQVAADANNAGQTYPDQSLYPVSSVPQLVDRINQALLRADQIECSEGNHNQHFLAPIIADAEAGFGGPLNAFELMKAMIRAGAAGVHFEDQLSSEKKCGHMGGKVLIPINQFIRTLVAARLAADIMNVPTVIIARTDALSAKLLTSDFDERDAAFTNGKRTSEGFFEIQGGIKYAIERGLAYAPYADVLWCETSTPDLKEAKMFAEAIRAKHPSKLLAYNCSPSFNWKRHLNDKTIANFQKELGSMGYRFQFVTLAGFHSLNYGMYQLAKDYKDRGMAAYTQLQEAEFNAEKEGYTATKHQREVGSGYFDAVMQTITGGESSTLALKGSTEEAQFH